MQVRHPPADLVAAVPAVYVVFDVLHHGGRSLLSAPYSERRRILERLHLAGPSWQTSPVWLTGGADVLAATREQGLEGVLSKRSSRSGGTGTLSGGLRILGDDMSAAEVLARSVLTSVLFVWLAILTASLIDAWQRRSSIRDWWLYISSRVSVAFAISIWARLVSHWNPWLLVAAQTASVGVAISYMEYFLHVSQSITRAFVRHVKSLLFSRPGFEEWWIKMTTDPDEHR